jgi:hypothetical protein
MKSVLDWNDVSLGMLVLLAIIGILQHLFIFTLLPLLPENILYTCIDKCIVPCKNDTCKKVLSYRDSGYYAYSGVEDQEKAQNCSLSSWEILHVLYHVFLGYFYNLYVSLAMSVGYELYEHYAFNAGSYLDLFWNMLGFGIGYAMRPDNSK